MFVGPSLDLYLSQGQNKTLNVSICRNKVFINYLFGILQDTPPLYRSFAAVIIMSALYCEINQIS